MAETVCRRAIPKELLQFKGECQRPVLYTAATRKAATALRSEIEPSAELGDAAGAGAGDPAEAIRPCVCIHATEIGVIHGVEQVCPQLDPLLLAELKILR